MQLTLPAPLRRGARFARRLRACEGGLAFIEFAMALPVLVTLGLVGLETANLAMAHLRVSNIAMLAADNAARVRDSIDEANVIELLTGAKMTGDSIRFRQNGRIILSSVKPNAAGLNGASTGQNNANLQAVGPPGNRIAATTGTAIMLVEVVYNYQPLVSDTIFGTRIIRYESAFNVRQRTNQVITNVGNATPKNCNVFNA